MSAEDLILDTLSLEAASPMDGTAPDPDVVLVADNDSAFRLPASCMAQHSQFVAELLQWDLTGSITDAPIPTHASAKHVRLYIQLARAPVGCDHRALVQKRVAIAEARAFLALCDRLQSRGLGQAYLRLIRRGIQDEPWEWFVLASEYDCLCLGRDALSALGSGNSGNNAIIVDIVAFNPNVFAPLRPSWAMALARARFPVNIAAGRKCNLLRSMDSWVSVAGDFAPNPEHDTVFLLKAPSPEIIRGDGLDRTRANARHAGEHGL